MAKTKTPFLSLGSQGTVGQAVTSQKRGSTTLLREKPLPAYRYTLPQAYQRWLYEDYAYLWRQQSLATKQIYATAGSRFHLTGFQYWMKYQLTNLPDIAGYWKLDSTLAATTPDSSRNANTGTIIGASPTTLAIDGALHFDGLNDLVDCGSDPSVLIDGDFTILCFLQTTDKSAHRVICSNRGTVGNTYGFYMLTLQTGGQLRVIGKNPTGQVIVLGTTDVCTGALVLASVTRLADLWTLSVDGTPQNTGNLAGNLTPDGPFCIGGSGVATYPFKNKIDQVIFFNRALSQTEIEFWVPRRYPS